MLKIKELSKSYKLNRRKMFTALDRVSLDIEDEKMVAIIGESGSGKSTLMNLVSTIDSPTGGYVEYDGKRVTFRNERKKAKYRRENIGFIFQSFNLLKDLSALENVEIVMEIAGVSKAKRTERAMELLALVGLEEMYNKKPGTLSGGQKQRVAIARALANDPDLILADEPTGSLDHKTSIEIMKLLSTISNSGKKVVIVTHDMNVASYCERIIAMEDGKIISDEKNDCKFLDSISIPEPLSGGLAGLKLYGIFKLSHESFKRKFKRNLLISIGTAISIASLLLVSISTNSIKGYIKDIEAMYGNPNIVKLIITDYEDFSELGKKSDESLLSGAEEEYKISEYEHIEKRVKYNFETAFNLLNISLVSGEVVNHLSMYPEDIDTFGSADILSGEIPKNINEVAISSDLIDTLGYSKENIIGKTIQLEISDYSIMEYGENSTAIEIDDAEDGVYIDVDEREFITKEGEPESKREEFVVTAILTNSSIRSFSSTIYFTDEYASKYGDESFMGFNTYSEIVVVEEGYADDFIDYLYGNRDFEDFSSSIIVSATKDLEIIMVLNLIVEGVFIVFSIILGISVFVAAIMIAVMSYVSILERIREVGVLRSVGAKKSDITKMFIHEATTIGILSGIIALILGISLSYVAINIVNSQLDETLFESSVKVVVSAKTVIVTLLGAILLSIVSSVISILLGLRVSPAEALRRK